MGEKRERKGKKDFLLLSKIYEDRIDGFRRSKRQSSFITESYAWVPKSWSLK